MFKVGKLLTMALAAMALCVAQAAPRNAAAAPVFRPPAVPLVTFDPYMSIWSEANTLTSHRTRYWDGRVQSLVSLVRIDGKAYRIWCQSTERITALWGHSRRLLRRCVKSA